jgi:hypothetical protein
MARGPETWGRRVVLVSADTEIRQRPRDLGEAGPGGGPILGGDGSSGAWSSSNRYLVGRVGAVVRTALNS